MIINKIPRSYFTPGSANTHPSYAEYGKYRIMTYRHESEPINANTRIFATMCNEHWLPESRGWMLNIPLTPNAGGEKVIEDSRLFIFDGRIYFSATNRNRIGIGHHIFEGNVDFAWIDVPDANPMEKNWGFFQYGNDLFGIRWVVPHEIWRIDLDFENGHKAEKICVDDRPWDWSWGIVHGGTNPVRWGNLFLSMFHSFTIGFPPHEGKAEAKEKTEDPQRKVNFAAPYAFEAKPPFRVVLVPTEPMIWPMLQTVERRSFNKDYTVFPVGLVKPDDNMWMCGYGTDVDCYQCWFTYLELMENLMPL